MRYDIVIASTTETAKAPITAFRPATYLVQTPIVTKVMLSVQNQTTFSAAIAHCRSRRDSNKRGRKARRGCSKSDTGEHYCIYRVRTQNAGWFTFCLDPRPHSLP